MRIGLSIVRQTFGDAMASFRLRLENTYWLKGFFNINVDFQRFVTMTDGPIEYLHWRLIPSGGWANQPNRQSECNTEDLRQEGSGRVLSEHLQARGARQVEIISPTVIRVGGQ